MKPFILLGAPAVVASISILALGGDVHEGPAPVVFGRDSCARCRMVLSEPGHSGQRLDEAGKLHKYDDIGCLLLSMWAAHRESPGAWVEDHSDRTFVPLTAATFAVDGDFKTPMGFGIAAFRDPARAREFAEAHGAKVVALEDLLHDTKRFNPKAGHFHGGSHP